MSRVSLSAAAQELGVNRSTVTRWTQAHPALKDENGRVSVDELRTHRALVIHPGNQTNTTPPPDTLPDSDGRPAASVNEARRRREEARAEEAELDLAHRRRQTLVRSEVEAAVSEAGEIIKQAALQLARDRADALALIDDGRAMEVALETLVRDLLDQAAHALAVVALDAQENDAA